MNLFVWNAQGCGNSSFIRTTKQYVRDHRPDICVFVETRISHRQADLVISSLGFPNSHRVEAQGFSGGIWLCWFDHVQISILSCHFQFIHCSISLPGSGDSFVATFVYTSPSRRYRYDLWKHLKSLSATVTRPWIVLGDFNATLSLVDRQGCSINSPDQSFQDMVLHCGLHDLGYSDPHFTWSRGSRSARLDRSFGNSLWFERYPHFFLHHLLRMKSDHRPIFLTSNDHSVPRRDRDFKYFSGWSLHPDFKRLVRESWDSIAPITDSIKLFSEAATKWNVEAKIRTRRKAVMSLMVDNGDWCTDHSILRDAATSFFRGLFDTDTDSPPSFPISVLFQRGGT
ncbi:hypothetical protein V6N13_025744 [Hibiscus sabdariffa]